MRFIAQRLLFFVGMYFAASFAIFLAVEAVPGDPVALRFGRVVDAQRVAEERAQLGLDRPWPQRYLRSQRDFFAGEWGRSLLTGRETTRDLATALPATLELSFCALALGSAVGLAVALAGSAGASALFASLARGIGAVGVVVPIFWIGILLLLIGSYWLGWFPSGGRFDMGRSAPAGPSGLLLLDAALARNGEGFAAAVRHLVLPTLCLSFYPMAAVSSVVWARLQEPEARGFVVALRARGMPPWRIAWCHLLRIAAAPAVTVIGTTIGALLGGAFLTETVFSWPGLGRYLVSAVLGRDVFAAQFVLTLLALLVVATALIADLIVWRLDPSKRGELK